MPEKLSKLPITLGEKLDVAINLLQKILNNLELNNPIYAVPIDIMNIEDVLANTEKILIEYNVPEIKQGRLLQYGFFLAVPLSNAVLNFELKINDLSYFMFKNYRVSTSPNQLENFSIPINIKSKDKIILKVNNNSSVNSVVGARLKGWIK